MEDLWSVDAYGVILSAPKPIQQPSRRSGLRVLCDLLFKRLISTADSTLSYS